MASVTEEFDEFATETVFFVALRSGSDDLSKKSKRNSAPCFHTQQDTVDLSDDSILTPSLSEPSIVNSQLIECALTWRPSIKNPYNSCYSEKLSEEEVEKEEFSPTLHKPPLDQKIKQYFYEDEPPLSTTGETK
ncbi:hypothetical protein CRE_17276 [Caenorhabditis remanei]|uniref:Uncharacterized protein n=1 Tax=Caenorhabditis remanei TaxID=31234 RepID=E3MAH9_CAERE|nr:hypothetical protein CRE_17276 [Caenorhabditis remanei]